MKVKIPYSIQRSMIKILPFIATAIMSASCHKEHDVVIDWRTGPILTATTPKETLLTEINKKNINTIFLDFGERNMTNWYPLMFHRVHDTLQMYQDKAQGRIRLVGTFYVSSMYGAHLPDVTIDTIEGMGFPDSVWFTINGLNVQRLPPLTCNGK